MLSLSEQYSFCREIPELLLLRISARRLFVGERSEIEEVCLGG